LYDALVSINVPNDKARAVVDAMERDMATTLATKQDLAQLATRLELVALEARVDSVEARLGQRIDALADRVDASIQVLRSDVARDLAEQHLRLTVRMGAMLATVAGLAVAAAKLL